MTQKNGPPPIAIVGIGLRLPGGIRTPEEFWNFLVEKKDGRCRVPTDRYNVEAFYNGKSFRQGVASDHGYFLQDVNLKAFDAGFFSMSKSELESLDPQQRLLLEVVWECMESAGQINWRGTKIGCYVGVFGEDWHDLSIMDTQATGQFRVSGADDFSISNRISYEYDLKGPCMTIRTACSSSLSSLHAACQALYHGECSAAIVAGSNLILHPIKTIAMTEKGVLSPTGSCKTFDAAADGYARGEAINAVLIKPLDDAIRNGDPIRAVIRSTAVNYDGKTITTTMPSAESHEAMMRRAYKLAQLSPSQTPFVECHGTGTKLGDRIEITAVGKVFGEQGAFIGAVKPNVGHSEGASGLTSLIKAVLALENEVIPPNINFIRPNPKLPLEQANLEVPVEAMPWPKDRHHRASVNCFGIGGSNAHVILDSASSWHTRHPTPAKTNGHSDKDANSEYTNTHSNGNLNGHLASRPHETANDSPRLLPVSANNVQSLQRRVDSLRHYYSSRPGSLNAIAHTLGTRREHLRHRAFCLARGNKEMLAFEGFQEAASTAPDVIFAFTGQGSQWAGMGMSLINMVPSFQMDIQEMDRVLQGLDESPKWTLQEMLCDDDSTLVGKAEFSQPLCTAMQIALVNLLSRYGITAAAIVAHSSGEIAGAYAAGAITAADAIKVAYYRGLIATLQTRKGSMAVVGLGRDVVALHLVDGVVIACENSPTNVVISGNQDAVLQTLEAIKRKDPAAFTQQLNVDTAYHSGQMRDVAGNYEELLSRHITGGRANLPFYSSITGQRIAADTLFDAAHWRRSLESLVLFHSAVKALLSDLKNNTVIVEIGPHAALQWPLRQIFQEHDGKLVPSYLPTLKRNGSCQSSVLAAVGQLYTLGYSVEFSAINPSATVLNDLPQYPWDHDSEFWNESRIAAGWRQRKYPHHELLGAVCVEFGVAEPAWRNVLRIVDVPWLQDHRIAEQIVFPAAGYIAAMGEAIRQMTGSESYLLRNLVIKSPLLLQESESDSVEIITSMRSSRLTDSNNSSWYDISISSFNKTSCVQHCFAQGKAASQQYSPPKRAISRYPRQISQDFWYERLRHAGLNYASHFQGLKDISAHTRETKATATLQNDTIRHGSKYSVHPITLDLCLQLFTVAAACGVAHHSISPSLPSSIGHICVHPGQDQEILVANAITHTDTKHRTLGQAIAATSKNRVVVEVDDAVFSPWDQATQPDNSSSLAVSRLEWRPDIDLVAPESLLQPGVTKRDSLLLIEKICALCVLQTLETLLSLEMDISANHLIKYASWLRNERSNMISGNWEALPPDAQLWATLDSESRTCLFEGLMAEFEREVNDDVLALSRLYRKLYKSENIRDIFLGKINAVELLAEDNGLMVIYNFYRGMMNLEDFFSLCGHSQPTLNVLEIGGGTGGTTQDVLKPLISKGGVRLYSKYTFTDISSGFFAAAKERFKEYSGLDFKVLDISKDPAQQGFVLGSYDLIVASNVLHATPSLSESLRNVRALLRPGGRLFLQELALPSCWRFLPFIMGYLPGWWLGEADGRLNDPRVSVERWDQELRYAGFSGTDAKELDDEMPYQINANIISTTATVVPVVNSVTILYKENEGEFSQELARRLEQAGIRVYWTTLYDYEHIPGRDIISTIEVQEPYFHDISDADYQLFMSFMAKLKTGMLWLTRSAQVRCSNPRYGSTIGLIRTIRIELLLECLTLELDNLNDAAINATLAIFQKFQRRTSSGDNDYDLESEFVVHDGITYIGRYYGISSAKELQLSEHDDNPKRLTIGRYGSIDSLEWVQYESSSLKADEVEIDILCVGLNFRDVLLTTGIVPGPKDKLGLEASGIVVRRGSAITHVKAGDRVITVDADCFTTRKTVNGQLVVRIPDDLSFEDAATMPVAFMTAMYSIINVGQLLKGQSILIHSACGGVGLAALQICSMLGAEVYVTVGNKDKVEYLQKNYSIQSRRIFSSRNDSFLKDVMQATNGQGVDVVLNSVSGELLHASWKCVAKYGKMMEIGKRDIIGRGHLMLDRFGDNRTFCGIDLAGLQQDKPDVIRKLMDQCIQYYQERRIQPIRPVKIFPAQRVAEAFHYMQSGQHIGKVLITFQEDSIPLRAITARKQTSFSNSSTYLMVGGLGGLGKVVTTWMVELGATSFVFLSRSAGTTVEDLAFIQELESQGCRVVTIPGSVVDPSHVKTAVQAAPTRVAGVIQFSMILKDSPLLQISHDDWRNVQDPKVRGTWNLHEALLGADLDFFILFSSVSGLCGQPGQAHYASANTFLDSFTQYRHSLKLPCSVIDAGIIEGVGYVSRNSTLISHFRNTGLHMLQPRDLIDAVEISIRRSVPPPPDEWSTTSPLRYSSLGQIIVGLKSSKSRSDPSNLAPWKRDVRMSLLHQKGSEKELNTDSKDGGLQQFISLLASNPEVLHDMVGLETVLSLIIGTLRSYTPQLREKPDASTSLSSIGIDSLASIELRNWFRRALGIDISILQIIGSGTVEQLGNVALASLQEKYGVSRAIKEPTTKSSLAGPCFNLAAEFSSYINAVWHIEGLIHSPVTTIPPQANIFLTGGTGYLGTEILQQLLHHSTVRSVVVLVRARSVQHAMDRIKETAKIAGWWRRGDQDKIEVWLGDLAGNQLGLHENQIKRLRGDSSNGTAIHAIVHNGAVVNWTADYEQLRVPNVESTLELLKIAASSRLQPKFIYISGGVKKTIHELSAEPPEELFGQSGYSQTKIMTESILREIISRLPAIQNRICIVKPGLIIGTADAGVANVDDVLWRAVAAVGALKAFPKEPNSNWLYIVGVDTVAKMVTSQLFSTTNENSSFIDMLDGMLISKFWEVVNQELQLSCSPMPWEEWVKLTTMQINQVGQRHPLWTVQHLLSFRTPLAARLEGATDNSPPLDMAVRASVRYLIRIGFIQSSASEMGKLQERALARSDNARINRLD